MKVLTEFSGTIIRLAAKAASEARSTLPPEPEPVVEAPAAEAEAPVEAAVEATTEAAVEATAEEAAPAADAEAAPEAAAPAEAAPAAPAAPAVDSDETKAILEEAIGKETNISGDRLARLREAVDAVGSKAADVRLVRVYSDESPLNGAKTIGAHQYVIDMMPKSMKQQFASPGAKDGKGGRGGRGGGARGGRGGGGGNREEGPLDGSFSMDSIKNDRGGRRGPGGR